jgi:putative hydrolase of the HAD superfamily
LSLRIAYFYAIHSHTVDRKIKAILFDLDDTLLVEWGSAMISYRQTITGLNSGIDKEALINAVIEEARINWYALPTIGYCLKAGISSWEALWAEFTGEEENLKTLAGLSRSFRLQTWHQALLRFGLDDRHLADRLAANFMEIRSRTHVLFPDTLSCLNALKDNFRLGLITNGPSDVQRKKIEGGNLKHYFDAIIISGEYGFAKPDERLYSQALEKLYCKPEEAVMVGDNLINDMGGGKKSGLTTIWVNRNGKVCDQPEYRPDDQINDLTSLISFPGISDF